MIVEKKIFFAALGLTISVGLVVSTQAHDGGYGPYTHEHFYEGTNDELEFPNGTRYVVQSRVGSSETFVETKDGKRAFCQTDGDSQETVDREACKKLLAEAVDSGEPKRPGNKKPPKKKKPKKESESLVLIKKGENKIELEWVKE